jgi:hypothetical protein
MTHAKVLTLPEFSVGKLENPVVLEVPCLGSLEREAGLGESTQLVTRELDLDLVVHEGSFTECIWLGLGPNALEFRHSDTGCCISRKCYVYVS